MKIYIKERCETVEYAAEELKKYVVAMSRGSILPEITDASKACEDGITLGTLEQLSLDTSDLSDPTTEDIVDANVVNGVGYLAGSNPRSIRKHILSWNGTYPNTRCSSTAYSTDFCFCARYA